MLSFSKSEPSKPHTYFALRLRRGRLGSRTLRVRFLDSLLKKNTFKPKSIKNKTTNRFSLLFQVFFKKTLVQKGQKQIHQSKKLYLPLPYREQLQKKTQNTA